MSASSSGAAKPRGYWLQTLLPIIKGTASYEKSEFQGYAVSLLDFRKNSPNALHRELESKRQELIDAFHVDYEKMRGISDLEKRFAILNNVFLQALIYVDKSLLDEADCHYVDNIGVYGAFKAVKEFDLYHSKVGEWAKQFTKAILFKETIRYNVESTKGLTPERAIELVDLQAAKVSGPWYQAFLEKRVSLDQVKALRTSLKASPLAEETALCPEMSVARQGYLELQKMYPEENQASFIKAVLANLKAFIRKVNP